MNPTPTANVHFKDEHHSTGSLLSSLQKRSNIKCTPKKNLRRFYKIWFAYFRKLLDICSLHGFRYIGERGRPFLERFYWMLVVAFVIYYVADTIEFQIKNYLSGPIVMSLSSNVVPAYDLPFPAITICPEHQTPVSLINITDLLETAKIRDLTDEEEQKIALLQMLCAHQNSEKIEFPNITADFASTRGVSVLHAIHLCKKVLKFIAIRYIPEKNPCSLIQIIPSSLGSCLSFNVLPAISMYTTRLVEDLATSQSFDVLFEYPYKYATSLSSWSPDTGYVTSETENDNNGDELPVRVSGGTFSESIIFTVDSLTDEIQESCKPRSNGFLMIVHNPSELPSMQHPLVFAEADKRTILHIKQNWVKTDENLRSWSPEQRGCFYSYERKLMFFKIYSRYNCETECEANLTRIHCNCTTFYQPHFYDTPICLPDQLPCHLATIAEASKDQESVKKACNCLPACNEFSYDVTVTTQPRNWTRNSMYYSILPNETKKDSYANIVVRLGSRNVNCVIRVGTMMASDFIANVGGLMGVFIGFSFVIIFEMVYFGIIRWMSDMYLRSKARKNWKKIAPARKEKNQNLPCELNFFDFPSVRRNAINVNKIYVKPQVLN